MAWLGFIPELGRNLEVMSSANKLKMKSLNTAQRFGKGYEATNESLKKGMDHVEEEATKLAEDAGWPGNKDMIAQARDTLEDEYVKKSNARMGKLNAAYESVRDQSIAGAKERFLSMGLDENRAADAAARGWDLSVAAPGVFDVFRQTASDRATALGITRFRATDGAMDTLNSFESLFYKDNNHMSTKGKAVVIGSAAAGAGALVGLGAAITED